MLLCQVEQEEKKKDVDLIDGGEKKVPPAEQAASKGERQGEAQQQNGEQGRLTEKEGRERGGGRLSVNVATSSGCHDVACMTATRLGLLRSLDQSCVSCCVSIKLAPPHTCGAATCQQVLFSCM